MYPNIIDVGHMKREVRNVINNTLTCEGLGMIPNSEAAGVGNYAKLTAAIVAGYKISVDNAYYLANSNFVNTTDITGISLEGVSDKAEFLFVGGGYLWKPQNNSNSKLFKFKNIKWTNTGVTKTLNIGVRVFYTTEAETFYIDEYTVENCVFIGGFALFQGDAKIQDPNAITFGFGRINIINNTFYEQWTNNVAFEFSDYPHELISIIGNKVYNMDNIFVDAGITNGHTYTANIYSAMQRMICKDNYFHNDDDMWGAGGRTPYYTIAVYEGVECYYTGNHFEGFKSDLSTIVQYDIYVGSQVFISENNTYKNNIHLTNSPAAAPSLIKCKGGGGDSLNATRYVSNNKYIIEEEWATTVATARGTNINKLYHQILDIQAEMADITIENCYFDVYYLDIKSGTSLPISNIILKNNTILAKYITGYFLYALGMSSKIEKLICVDNYIKSTAEPTTGTDGTGSYASPSIAYINSTVNIPYIDVSRNTLELHGYPTAMFRSTATNPITKLKFDDNKITYKINTTANELQIFQESCYVIDDLSMKNNDVKFEYTSTPYPRCRVMRTPSKITNISYKLNGRVGDIAYIFGLNGDNITTTAYYIRATFKIFNSVSHDEFYIDLKYYYDEVNSRNALDFVDPSSVAKTALLLKSSDALTAYTSENDTLIKLNPVVGSAPTGHTLKLKNASLISTTAKNCYGSIFLTMANNGDTSICDFEVDVKTITVG